MTIITYPAPGKGRGAWSPIGGTLRLDGKAVGDFYRAPATAFPIPMPGTTGFRAYKFDYDLSVNDLAVYLAVIAIQNLVGAKPDGLYGPMTGHQVAIWQEKQKIAFDGIFGPKSSETAYRPWVLATAKTAHPLDMAHLGPLTSGHIKYESRYDLGAVGQRTPHDLGLAQINGIAHPDMNERARFEPETSIQFAVELVAGNIAAFPGDEDAQIAAYNLGRTGAKNWVAAGKPDIWGETNVRKYINDIYDNI